MEKRRDMFGERRKVLCGDNVRHNILDMVERQLDALVNAYCAPDATAEEWDLAGLAESASQLAPTLMDVPLDQLRARDALQAVLTREALAAYERKEQEIGEPMREGERIVLLQTIHRQSIAPLYNM